MFHLIGHPQTLICKQKDGYMVMPPPTHLPPTTTPTLHPSENRKRQHKCLVFINCILNRQLQEHNRRTATSTLDLSYHLGYPRVGPKPRVTKTLAAWQRCCAEILAVWWILLKFLPKFTLFCHKIPSKCCPVFKKKEKKKIFYFVEKFPQILLQPFWKFPQKVAFIAHFD